LILIDFIQAELFGFLQLFSLLFLLSLVFFLLLLLLGLCLFGRFLLFFLRGILFVFFATFYWGRFLCFFLGIGGFCFLLFNLFFSCLRVCLSASKPVVCANLLLLCFIALCSIRLFLESHEQHLQVLSWHSITDQLNSKFGIWPVLTL